MPIRPDHDNKAGRGWQYDEPIWSSQARRSGVYRALSGRGAYDRVVRAVCSPNCMSSCGVNAFVRDDRIVKLEPASYPVPGFERICGRGIAMATQRLHHPDRLTHPMIRKGERGAGEWRRVSWDEAFEYIIAKQEKIAAAHGWRANAWLKGSGNYGQRMNMSVQRTTNILGGTMFSNIQLSGDAAAIIAFKNTLGDLMRSNDPAEIAGARYVLCAGKSVADTGHSEMHRLFDAMENGTKYVNVDPRFSRSSAKADEWVAPRPGTDAALVMGMLNVVVSEELMQHDYVVAHTNGPFLVRQDTRLMLRERDLLADGGDAFMVWDDAAGVVVPAGSAERPALRGSRTVTGTDGAPIECRTGFDENWEVWKHFTPEHAATICDVPADQIRHVAREYASADPAWIWLGFGSQRYAHGHLGPRAWITLAALCGNIGKPYAGVNLNESPGLVLAFNAPASYLKPSGQSAPSLPATRLLEIIEREDPWPIKSMWMVASGFGTQTPFLDRFVRESLPKLDLLVVNEQMMSPIAEYADVVLPIVSYYEDDWDLIASGETWFVQLRRRVVPPVGESRSDHDVFKELCERLGQGEFWQESPPDVCRRLLAENGDARMRAVDWDVLERDGVARIVNEVPYTPFKDMKFMTPSGRIELYQEQFVPEGEAVLLHKEPMESRVSAKAAEFPLCLISYKHPHSSHAQHLMLPYIREMMPEPRVEISPVDAADRDIADGELVRVYNDRGAFTVKALVTPGLKPGTMAIAQGWWPRDFLNGHPSFLGHTPRDAAQEKVAAMGNEANYPIWDLLCNVVKAEATQ